MFPEAHHYVTNPRQDTIQPILLSFLMQIPDIQIPVIEIPTGNKIRLFIKREDLIHPEISGNKYWKLFCNLNTYLEKKPYKPFLITFGGAYSNHIAAVAAVGRQLSIPTLGIIRGEELHDKWQQNQTLNTAAHNGMRFRFVTRDVYRNKATLSQQLQEEFPHALLIPEGGTNALAVKGIQHMLGDQTKSFDYLCAPVGTGGTVAGISKFAQAHQKVLGFTAVNDTSLAETIDLLSGRKNVELIEAHLGAYGKITDENIRFINTFYQKHQVPLDPVYTGKMMMKVCSLADSGFFPDGSKVLAFHTGGLQGIAGANQRLGAANRPQINFGTY